jgi:hypothetical protein
MTKSESELFKTGVEFKKPLKTDPTDPIKLPRSTNFSIAQYVRVEEPRTGEVLYKHFPPQEQTRGSGVNVNCTMGTMSREIEGDD